MLPMLRYEVLLFSSLVNSSEPALDLTLYMLFSAVEVHQQILPASTLSDVMAFVTSHSVSFAID